MKKYISEIFVTFILLTGCSSTNIGNHYRFISPNASVDSNLGYLKVFTYKYDEQGTYASDPVNQFYKGYAIYTKKGDLVKNVQKSYRQPKLIKLPEGDYIVIAELRKNIIQSFEISIEKEKMLEIDKSMITDPLTSK
jgi:hypothetical protein